MPGQQEQGPANGDHEKTGAETLRQQQFHSQEDHRHPDRHVGERPVAPHQGIAAEHPGQAVESRHHGSPGQHAGAHIGRHAAEPQLQKHEERGGQVQIEAEVQYSRRIEHRTLVIREQRHPPKLIGVPQRPLPGVHGFPAHRVVGHKRGHDVRHERVPRSCEVRRCVCTPRPAQVQQVPRADVLPTQKDGGKNQCQEQKQQDRVYYILEDIAASAKDAALGAIANSPG